MTKIERTNVKRQMRALVKAPKMIDANPNGKRTMYHVKAKIKLADFVIKHEIRPILAAAQYTNMSSGQVKAWVKDRKAGILTNKNAVSVKR